MIMLLQVSRSTISNVRVSSVEKVVRPLIQASAQGEGQEGCGVDWSILLLQVWFDLVRSAEGVEGDTRLMQLVDSGELLATVRRKEDSNFISYRLNL